MGEWETSVFGWDYLESAHLEGRVWDQCHPIGTGAFPETPTTWLHGLAGRRVQANTHLSGPFFPFVVESRETWLLPCSRGRMYRARKATLAALPAAWQQCLPHFPVVLAALVCRETLRKMSLLNVQLCSVNLKFKSISNAGSWKRMQNQLSPVVAGKKKCWQ